jgi:ferric-dicitrate binding protein FerR (iron transport regulator)
MAAQSSMNVDRILELLAKQMGNAASEADLIELEYLIQQYPNHRHLVSILKSIRSKKLKQPAQNEELIVKEGWEKLQLKIKEISLSQDQPQNKNTATVKSLFAKTQVKWAAVWIGLIFLSSIIYFKLIKPGHANTMAPVLEAVLHGKPEMKTLPDGTVVWINAGSKISYKAEQGTRDVYLEGEAYFKVKHDAEHPFVVHAGNLAVRALGTEFNVSAYPGDDHVETTLIKGKVQVTMEEKPDQKIILAPNEKLTVVNKHVVAKDTSVRKEISYEVKPVEILPVINEAGEVAWMQDKLAFQNETFISLAKKMERRYNVHIVFRDESLKKEALSGIFRNENIQKALRVLQMTTPFQYRMKADSIFLDRP